MPNRTLVFIPTYNESENVERLCNELVELKLDIDIVFLDDNSPDGTGKLLDELASKHDRVSIIHRSEKSGIGSAHKEGIRLAYEGGYQNLITMDSDFTHPPSYIPMILEQATTNPQADIIVGSRYMSKDSLPGWNVFRRSLTHLGHVVTVALLNMPFDATGALRLYRLDRIPARLFGLVNSDGYSFFFESLFVLHKNKFQIAEFPISLPARTYGSSKMNLHEVVRSVKLLLKTFLIARLVPEKYDLGEPLEAHEISPELHDPQGWDYYWQEQKETGGLVYDILASIYRRVLIKPNLDRFAKRFFKRGEKVLHAGCGSGQVDADLRKYLSITGMDISLNALRFYRKVNGASADVLHGSIFSIPLADNSVDGVYNLGVMEHFTEEEIVQILSEFKRVVRPGGKLLLFWPPEFGFSVRLFKFLTWFSKTVLGKKDVKFHPDEITRLQSKQHVVDLLAQVGLPLSHFSFGPRDMFTCAVVVSEIPQGGRHSEYSYEDNEMLVAGNA